MSSQWPPSSSLGSSSSSSSAAIVLPVEQIKNEPDKIGKALAEAVLRETALKRKILPTPASQRLVSEAPARSKLSFSDYGVADQKKDEAEGQDPELSKVKKELFKSYIKAKRAGDIASSEDEDTSKDTLLFSMPDGKWNSISLTDIEHATSYEAMSENIEELLNFLNKKGNEAIKKVFLEHNGKDKHAITIQHLFGTEDDDPNKPAQARQYLYTVCYNQEKNLWLIGHDSNMKKGGDSDWVDWCKTTKVFKGQYLNDVQARGGVKRGVIFEFIPKSSSKTVSILGFGDICKEGDGLGEFTHNWFMAGRSPYFKAHQEFHNNVSAPYSESTDAMLEAMEAGEDAEASILRQRLHKSVRRSEEIHSSTMEGDDSHDEVDVNSPTRSESDEDRAAISGSTRRIDKKSKLVKLLEDKLNELYPDKEKENHRFLSKLRFPTIDRELESGDNRRSEEVIEKLEKKFNEEPRPSRAEIEEFIKIELRTLREAYEQEKKARIAVEKENAELKAEIARMKMEKQQTAPPPSSSTNASDSIMPLSSGLVELATNEPLVPYSDSEEESDPSENTIMDLEKTTKNESSESRIAAARHEGQLARESQQHPGNSASKGQHFSYQSGPHHATQQPGSAQPANANPSANQDENESDPNKEGHDNKRQKRI